ncbi:mitochondrial fission 1 protein [Ceraceosorus bombacis]|uniref:Mitochondrial fission 1 protein n=1 Tax=Ceraceosorus bombacis TaxID=401625 RepID=A0A0P1BNW4_9BASI|nr:mitochondrial fission 1 protein [Ceraceosorus bombacis]
MSLLNHRTTTTSLPYALDASTPLSPSELNVLRGQYEKERASGHATTQTKFNYAWGLVKSDKREEVGEGVGVLADIYRSDPPRRRECLYYLSLGHYKMGNFDEARRFNYRQTEFAF